MCLSLVFLQEDGGGYDCCGGSTYTFCTECADAYLN